MLSFVMPFWLWMATAKIDNTMDASLDGEKALDPYPSLLGVSHSV